MPYDQELERDYSNDPVGEAKRWAMEFKSAKLELKQWQQKCEDAQKAYLDDRNAYENRPTKWNIFNTGVNLKMSVLYGKPPQVNVTRRFEDPDDQLARVAAEMAERLLNTDIQRDDDDYQHTLRNALFDRLVAGISIAREVYVVEHKAQEQEPGPDQEATETADALTEEVKAYEDVETHYIHWQDFLWSPARTFGEMRWIAFRAQMKRNAVEKRFGEEIARRIPLNSKKSISGEYKDSRKSDPWARADVWEIWDKEHKKVIWYVDGFKEALDIKPDPYELEGFFPIATPMIANLSTAAFVPTPDYWVLKDVYEEINEISARIVLLEKAVSVRGVYDKSSKELKDVLNSTKENKMIPVPNWGAFQEKGGFKGSMDFIPLEMIVMALDKLREYRRELIDYAQQTDATADIVRGQQMQNGTPGEAQIKAKFAGIRIQSLQEEFARFAADLQQIRFDLICKFFDVQTIVEKANMAYSMDKNMALQAAEFLKSNGACYRIEIKPEQLAQTDFAQLKDERSEWLGQLATFISSAAPMIQQFPTSAPFLLEVAKWTMEGLRGSSTIGGIFEQFIAKAEQVASQPPAPQGPPPPDPRVIAQQQKQQGDMQKIQATTQSELMRAQNETQQLAQRKMNDAMINVKEEQARHAIKNGGLPPLGGGL